MFICPLVLSFVENDFDFAKLLYDSEAFFIGYVILLDSHTFAQQTKITEDPCTCSVDSAIVLAAIVLWNCYRGANIDRIGASYANIPFETFDQLLKNNFDIFTFDTDIDANGSRKDIEDESRFVTLKVPTDKLQSIINYTKIAYRAKSEVDDEFDLMEETLLIIMNQRNSNASDIIAALRPCNRSAWVDYKPELEIVYKELYKIQKENLYIGKETVFSKTPGIILLRWIDPRVEMSLGWLKVSGILDIWFKAKYEKGTYEITEPVKLSMKGNIVTVFIILFGGLNVSTLCCIVEIICHEIPKLLKTINIHLLKASKQLDVLFYIIKQKCSYSITLVLFKIPLNIRTIN